MTSVERGWFEVIWERLKQRHDLMAGIVFLTVAMTAVIAFGARSLGLPVQILLVIVGMVPNLLVILGLVYDCADSDLAAETHTEQSSAPR